MGKLYFRIGADFDKVIKLREEIAKLKQELLSLNVNKSADKVKILEDRLGAASSEFKELTEEAAKAGAMMEHNLKKQIFDASQVVNGLSEKMTLQRGTIQQLKNELSGLKDKYREALKVDGDTSLLEAKIESTSAKLRGQKEALFNLTQEQANARLSVKKLRDEYALFQNDGKEVIETNKNIGLSLGKALGVIGGVAALKQLGSEIIRVRGEFQSMQTAMETMVGKDIAGPLMVQIKELAKISPLTMSDMVGAEKMMLGFNIQTEDTIKYLKALSDISMGESGKFNSLTLAFSQMSAAGKLMGQDLNQMINAGFNPLQTISEKTGKSIATLKNEMSEGSLTAEMIQQAFIDATSAGGKFYQMSENASKTINGQISMMQDALDNVFNELGTKGEGVIVSGIKGTTLLIENYETVGKVLVGLVATYGTYKAAMMAYYAMTKTYGVYDIVTKELQFAATMKNIVATKAMTVQQALLNKTMLANPYVLLATLVVGAAAAMWSLHDSTTAAERAQERYNKKVEDAKEKERSRKEGLEKLVAELQNVYTAELRKIAILAILEKEYPAFFKFMLDERGHVKDLTEAWRAYNEEVEKNRVAENKQNVENIEKSLNERKRFLELSSMKLEDRQEAIKSSPDDKDVWKKYNAKGIYYIKKDIEDLENDLAQGQKDVSNDIFNQWQVDLKNRTDEQIKAELEEAQKIQEARKTIKGMIIPVTLGTSPGAFSDEEIGNRASVMQQELDTRVGGNKTVQNKSFWETKKKEAEDARAALDVSKKNSEDWNKYTKEIELAQKKIDLYSNPKVDKPDKELENQKKLSSQILQLQFDNQQTEINLMTDSAEKKRKQVEFDYDKEIALIKEKEAELIKLNGNKPLEGDQGEQVQSAYRNAGNKRDRNLADINLDGLRELLAKYQDYDAKRRDIEEKFTADYTALEKQRTPENSKQITAAQGELGFKKEDALEQVDVEFASREEEFQSWMDSIATMSLDQLGATLREAQVKLGMLEISGKGGPQLAVAKQKVDNAQKAITKERSKKKTESPDKRSFKDWKDLNEVLNDANKSFKEIGDSVGGVAGEMISSAGEITASTLSMINGITTLADWSTRATELTAKGVSKSIQTVEKASVILAVISAAVQIATKISSLLAGKSKAAEDSERLSKVTDKIAETNEIVNRLIERRVELIKKATAAEREGLQQSTKDIIKIQKERAELEFQKLRGNEILGKKGKDNDLDVEDLGINNIKDLKDFLSSQELLDLEANGYGLTDEDKWFSIVNSWDELNDQALQFQENAAKLYTGINFDEAKDGLDDLLMSADTTMKDISDNFEDYMRNSILNIVKQTYLDDEMKKWYDDFSKRTADKDLSEDDAMALEKEYKRITEEAQKRINDGLAAAGLSLDASEQSATSGGFETMSQDTGDELNGRFTALQMIGTEVKDQSILQTEILSKIHERMEFLSFGGESSPTLSINQSSLESRSLESFMAKTDAILTVNSDVRNIADEIRTIQVNSFMELQEIRENTGAIVKPIHAMADKLERIDRKMQDL